MTTDTVGGVFHYALGLCRAFSNAGVQVGLASMGPAASSDQRARLAEIPGLTFFESEFELEWKDEPWSDVGRAGDWLLGVAAKLQPDLVHLNGYCHAQLDWRVPTLVVAHSCVASWWQAVLGEPAPERYAEYRRRVGEGLASADAVVAPSHAMLEALQQQHGRQERAHVIPNGIEPALFRSAAKEPFFLAAGRLWDQAKNLTLLQQAVSELPWPLHLAGEAPPSTSSPSGMRLLGRLPQAELASEMSRASVFVHPAKYEPFGLAPLEAAASGCALLLGDIPSLREVWGDAADYVAPDDLAALVTKARRLALDHDHRMSMARRAHQRAQRFRLDTSARAYLRLYAELGTGSVFAAVGSPRTRPKSHARPGPVRLEEPR
ncbi:MAG TPA: glycosyltransferase family 4 protein [Polyangiaceae bacterium]|nr:glycosyltransferase family 4 protein [Polyangiaceae bacterium]